MLYSFASVGAVPKLKLDDYLHDGARRRLVSPIVQRLRPDQGSTFAASDCF